MDRLQAMQTFRAVVEAGSFAGGARRLGLSNAMVSKQVAGLEAQLGVRLLTRTTRRLHLTAEGERYLRGAARLLDELHELEAGLGEQRGEIRGRLRLSAPLDFGVRELVPALQAFEHKHPAVQLEVMLEDRRVDPLAEDFDLVVRIGELEDSSLIARRLMPMPRHVYAAPSYLKRHGVPRHPDELRMHRCLHYSLQRGGPSWTFIVDGKLQRYRFQPVMTCNNGRALAEAASRGMGLVYKPAFLGEPEVARGRLVHVLDEFVTQPLGVYLLYAERDFMPARLQALIHTLREHFVEGHG
ncbi:LysR family transcriptional regulator [Halomonas sp. McH1-25]|uniref:LysR family transcriptional regulator n=1 Tax=unclassified Halomonas TaxID=2609666 RepID=UPI001EF57A1D|nr:MULTISPECIES: LysR family transcriptional regulator [unclassified Halomonas]MCG7600939.1 LysR family transcriptional regulator [Halomonas sp. McH1-25]MCP1341527.1 LysR family transcriptional regulator [Halomonas sp. FL8]MCP1359787.1 LysR family transcriptional regulator [Halomonas sp. BBD45]MCP1365554.1 LysR family transcriptional regulator [Halomonas sp. BBD48]